MPDAHLYRKTLTHLAVIDFERANLGFARGDLDMARAVMAHQDNIAVEIHGVVLGEGAASAKGVHDLHGLGVFHLVLTRDGDALGGEEGVAQNHGAHHVLVLLVSGAHVVISERTELLTATSLSKATAVRAARSSSAGEQSF